MPLIFTEVNIQKIKIMASSPITSWKIKGEKVEVVTNFIFLGSRITVDSDCSHEIKKCLLIGRKAMTNLDSILKSRDITLLTKVHLSQNYGFSSSHVWMWELDYKESWALTSWCFWTVVLEKTLESPLHSEEMKSINPKGNPSWIFIGRTDAEAETPILWPVHLIWGAVSLEKTLKMGKTEGRRSGQQRMRWLDDIINSMDMSLTPGNSGGQRSLACCSPWGCTVRHDLVTENNK